MAPSSSPSSSADVVPDPPDPERPSPTSPGPATSPETGTAVGVGENTHMPMTPELRITECYELGRWSALSPAQELAVFLHAGGMGFTDIAKRLEVSRQSVTRWFIDEAVLEAVEDLRGEMRTEVRAAFTAAGREAVYACLLALQMAVKGPRAHLLQGAALCGAAHRPPQQDAPPAWGPPRQAGAVRRGPGHRRRGGRPRRGPCPPSGLPAGGAGRRGAHGR